MKMVVAAAMCADLSADRAFWACLTSHVCQIGPPGGFGYSDAQICVSQRTQVPKEINVKILSSAKMQNSETLDTLKHFAGKNLDT